MTKMSLNVISTRKVRPFKGMIIYDFDYPKEALRLIPLPYITVLPARAPNHLFIRDEEPFDDARIKEVFEVCRCAVWIKRHNFHNTTLQFPDHLLQYAPIVAKQIGKESERR